MTMKTKDYTGWTIRYGFLDGNLLDDEAGVNMPASVRAYRDLLEERLSEAFPGAEVAVSFQERTSGSLPYPMRPAAFNEDGEEEQAATDRVQQIGHEAWEGMQWIVDA